MPPVVHLQQQGNASIVTPAVPRLDALVAPEFRDAVLDKLAGSRLVVLSLEHVRFMDSSGLAAVISVLKRLPAGGELRLAHVAPNIAALLKLTRLDRVLPAFATTEEALGGAEARP